MSIYPKLHVIISCSFLADIGDKGVREEIQAGNDLAARPSTDSTSVRHSDYLTSKAPAILTSENFSPSTDAVAESIEKLIGGKTKLKGGSLNISGKTQDRKLIACRFQFLVISKVLISVTFSPFDVEFCNSDSSGFHGSG